MKAKTILRFGREMARPATWGALLRVFQSLCEDQVFPLVRLQRGERTYIHPSVNFRCAENIRLGRNVRLQPGVCLWASPRSSIRIGDDSGLGPGTRLFSSNHRYAFGTRYVDQPWEEKDIVIGSNVWVGAGCIVTAGVTIGDGAVVAAGSVVTRDVPPESLAAGAPARVLRQGEKVRAAAVADRGMAG